MCSLVKVDHNNQMPHERNVLTNDKLHIDITMIVSFTTLDSEGSCILIQQFMSSSTLVNDVPNLGDVHYFFFQQQISCRCLLCFSNKSSWGYLHFIRKIFLEMFIVCFSRKISVYLTELYFLLYASRKFFQPSRQIPKCV